MKRTRIFTLTMMAIILGASVAYASSGGEGGEHGLPWGNFFFRVVNFAIVGGILYKFAGGAIKNLFVGRRENIKQELEDLAVRRKEAEAKLADVEKSIANIAQEREDILAEFARQGERQKEAIIAEAERKAEQMKAQAEASIASERKAALESLREEVAEMIIESAESLLKKKLNKAGHQKLIDEYLTKVVLN